MADQHPLVLAWAQSWASDPTLLAACYTENATLELPGMVAAHFVGRDQIADHAARLAFAVPDRHVDLVRLVHAGRTLVAEWVFTGRNVEDLVTMAAPGLTWWDLDDNGRIANELRVVQWSTRRIADAASHPHLKAGTGPTRSSIWYREFADRLLDVVSPYPDLALSSLYRHGASRHAVIPAPSAPPDTHTDTHTHTHTESGAGLAARRPSLVAVVGQGSVMAVRFDPSGTGHAAVIVELDDSDRIVDERSYHGSWWPSPI